MFNVYVYAFLPIYGGSIVINFYKIFNNKKTANEVGVNLKQGYNGDLTAKQAGSIGGQMVNNICPVRHMNFTRNYRWVNGHEKQFTYNFRLVV